MQGLSHQNIERLQQLGMEIGSHSVSHSRVFSRFELGSGEERAALVQGDDPVVRLATGFLDFPPPALIVSGTNGNAMIQPHHPHLDRNR